MNTTTDTAILTSALIAALEKGFYLKDNAIKTALILNKCHSDYTFSVAGKKVNERWPIKFSLKQ